MPFISAALSAIGTLGLGLAAGSTGLATFMAIGKAVIGIGYSSNARKIEVPRDSR